MEFHSLGLVWNVRVVTTHRKWNSTLLHVIKIITSINDSFVRNYLEDSPHHTSVHCSRNAKGYCGTQRAIAERKGLWDLTIPKLRNAEIGDLVHHFLRNINYEIINSENINSENY